MNNSVIELNLDFQDTNVNKVYAHQYDTIARVLNIHCFDDGNIFEVDSESCMANIRMVTPSGSFIYDPITINEDGSLTLELTTTMLSQAGTIKACVEILGLTDDKVLSTMNFEIFVQENTIPSEEFEVMDEFQTIQELAVRATTAEANAQTYMDTTEGYMDTTEGYMDTTEGYMNTTEEYMNTTEGYKDDAEDFAIQSESYAVGGTDTRDGEDSDNAKYYKDLTSNMTTSVTQMYNRVVEIDERLGGALNPKGTITFAQIPTSGMKAGDMYNISEGFTSDSRFKDGGNISYGMGTNIYWTSDDMWDCLTDARSGMELSQAQYDALTDAQKNNGTTYFITDAEVIEGVIAEDITYTNTISELNATDVQSAIDELVSMFNSFTADINAQISAILLSKQNTVLSGTSEPDNSIGENEDIYIKYEEV